MKTQQEREGFFSGGRAIERLAAKERAARDRDTRIMFFGGGRAVLTPGYEAFAVWQIFRRRCFSLTSRRSSEGALAEEG